MSLEQRGLCFKTCVELVDAASTAVSEQPVESGRSTESSRASRQRKTHTAKSARNGQDVEERLPPVYTYEPVNMAVLRDIASRRGAEKFHLKGFSVSLRECIFNFLRCVGKRYGRAFGSLTVVWREASTLDELGLATRRFSGCAPLLYEDHLDGPMEHMRRLVAEGVPMAFVGRSLFGMPKLLRHIARTGLDACDLDQVNSHVCAQVARHPAAPPLKHYIENRAAIIQEVAEAMEPQSTWPPDWTAEGAAKVLFLS